MKIRSLDDIIPIIENYKLKSIKEQNTIVIFRGQSKNNYQLLPGISRNGLSLNETLEKEKTILNEYFSLINDNKFKHIQKPSSLNNNKKKYQEEWFYLFQGQHLGLTTRLLDWTINWQTALLFVVESNFGIDGQFWINLFPKDRLIHAENINKIYNIHPCDITGTYLINQPFYQFEVENEYIAELRRFRQYGRFLIQQSDYIKTPLETQPELKDRLFKYLIDGEAKENIKKELLEKGHNIKWKYYINSKNIDDIIMYLNKLQIRST